MVQINDEIIRLIMREDNVVLVGSVDKQGTPNISPRFVLSILDDEKLLFADVFTNKTFVNIKAWPKVTVAILDKSTMGGFQLKGDVEEISDAALLSQAESKLKEFGLDIKPQKVWMLTVKEIYSLIPSEKSRLPLAFPYG